MLKLRWNGNNPPLYLLSFKESRKAVITLVGYLEANKIEYPIYPIQLKRDKIPHFPDGSIVALSFMSTRWNDIKNLIESLKRSGQITVIAGGPHPAGRWKDLLEDYGFSAVFYGEGEIPMLRFIQYLRGKITLEDVPGICYKIENKIKCNEKQRLPSLDLSPGYTVRYKSFPSIEITRGCPYLCQYCQTPQLFGRKPRHRSLKNIEEIVKKYLSVGKKDFRFITPNAFGYLDPAPTDDEEFVSLVKMLHKTINGRGRIFIGSFPSEIRPDYVTPEKVEIVKKYCANDNLVLGAQSGSDRILKKMKRAHSVEDVIRAVEIITDFNLIANVDFIFGNPGEEDEDIEATIELMHKLIRMGARVHGHYFMPLPGTPWENEKPVVWDKKYLKILGKLTREGKLYGSWATQMRFTERLD